MGINPATHRPKNSDQSKHAADVHHMAQWEAARLQAEARLTRKESSPSHLNLPRNKVAIATPRPSLPQPRLTVLPCLDVLKVWQATTTTQSSLSGSPLENFSSPISSLSFSGPVPAVSGMTTTKDDVMVNGYSSLPAVSSVTMDNANLAQPLDSNDFDTTSSMDVAALNHNSEGYQHAVDGAIFEEFQDTMNCWNELVNLVGSPLDLPWSF